MNMKKQLYVACLAMGLALTALADGRRDDDERRTPAAPEPALILMAIGGVGVAGGYVALRLYRSRKNNQ